MEEGDDCGGQWSFVLVGLHACCEQNQRRLWVGEAGCPQRYPLTHPWAERTEDDLGDGSRTVRPAVDECNDDLACLARQEQR